MVCELIENVEIELPLEGNDETRQRFGTDPFPSVEFRMVGHEIDLAVAPHKAHEKPFLRLSAKPPAPDTLRDLRRQIVMEPSPAFRDDFRRVGADLLFHFAQGRLARGLAAIDAALRHLPGFPHPILARPQDTPADEYPALRIKEQNADPRPIGCRNFRKKRRGHFATCSAAGLTATAEAGASTRFLPSSVAVHATSRSMVAGSAETNPIALPKRRA